ncbi:DUF3455 domain-containing protein [Methylocapsa polymorpha]|uniref:DUF3455 domain-containing protein n=1 Tax=Methylocapsa polymorpha TaxID=3080828 RepID=A0ABZ0HUE5_9HYPH|nr:DUF3455 domain-containing protein [Methylocapsa sp. RX1]
MKRFGIAVALSSLACVALAQEKPLAPPEGAKPLFELAARGVQVYVCEEKDKTYAWVFQEPAATLFDAEGQEVGTHSKGPKWTLSDGSSVTGELVSKQASPQQGAVPWLLLDVKSHEGAGRLADAAYILRVNTRGGAEPDDGCEESQKGETVRIRYSASYKFFGK